MALSALLSNSRVTRNGFSTVFAHVRTNTEFAPYMVNWLMECFEHVKSKVNLAKGLEDLGYMRCFQDRILRCQGARRLFHLGEESTEAMGEYSDDHPPPEDFATNEVEVLDPVVDDDQLQQQFYEDD
jgi:hypothetical protein